MGKNKDMDKEMEPALPLQVIGMLFPPQECIATEQSQETTRTVEWTDDWEVTEEELWKVTRRMDSRTGSRSVSEGKQWGS